MRERSASTEDQWGAEVAVTGNAPRGWILRQVASRANEIGDTITRTARILEVLMTLWVLCQVCYCVVFVYIVLWPRAT